MNLPEGFQKRMQEMLGEEYPAFLASYEKPRRRGLRVNTLKTGTALSEMKETGGEYMDNAGSMPQMSASETAIRYPGIFPAVLPMPPDPVPWAENGFYVPDDVFPSRHPYYAAGLYYLQEPSAMAPAAALPLPEDGRVLDLCAAPGGKATALASRMAGRGLLVANEIHPARAKALLRNMELTGARNALVTNETPERLAEVFPLYFDSILVDAPCSGEGMFRKEPEAAPLWSEDRVEELASLQRKILDAAVRMLRPGGYLLYSTCTFSPSEDEQNIAHLLREYPGMSPECIPAKPGFSAGRPEWADGNPALAKCVRIWPHLADGEGHFMALLRKGTGAPGLSEEGMSGPDRLPDSGYAGGTGAVSGRRLRDEGRPGEQGASWKQIPQENRKNRERNAGGNSRKGPEEYDRKHRGSGQSADRDGFGKTGRQMRHGNSGGEADGPALLADFLRNIPDTAFSGRLDIRGGKVYLVQDAERIPSGLHFLRNGLLMGEFRPGRFEPSQQLALALTKDTWPDTADFSAADERLPAFLRGESVTAEAAGGEKDRERDGEGTAEERIPNPAKAAELQKNDPSARSRAGKGKSAVPQWTLVCADGFGVGWARRNGSLLKNKIPPAWRTGS